MEHNVEWRALQNAISAFGYVWQYYNGSKVNSPIVDPLPLVVRCNFGDGDLERCSGSDWQGDGEKSL